MPSLASSATARRLILGVSFGVLIAAPVHAQSEDGMRRANHMAYQSAMKCFVANGIVVSDARDARNAAKEAAFDAKAHQSFDLAYLAGHELGVSQERVTADLKAVQDVEMPKMTRDAVYFKEAVAHCKALGLM